MVVRCLLFVSFDVRCVMCVVVFLRMRCCLMFAVV